MKPNTTLKKISQILDISISTVSRALKDHPDISVKTKQRVMELANTLEYEPNTYAVQLRTNSSKVLGLIVPSISNYFYDSFIAAVEEDARKQGYSVIILQSGNSAAVELTNLKICRQNRVNGLFVCITSETTNISDFLKLDKLDVPVIFFDNVPDDNHCNKICMADAYAAAIAAEALLKTNKQNILALFGNENLSITKKRLKAFKEVFDNTDKVNITIEYAGNAEEARIKTQHQYDKQKPDAIFCMSDEILTGAMKTVQRLQLNIPRDIGIISISNGYIPKLYYPEISYVETSGYKLGNLCFERMMSCLAGNKIAEEITIGCSLVKGDSL